MLDNIIKQNEIQQYHYLFRNCICVKIYIMLSTCNKMVVKSYNVIQKITQKEGLYIIHTRQSIYQHQRNLLFTSYC